MPLKEAIAELNEQPKIDIKGKKYSTVATRVEVFRKHFPPPDYGIETEFSIADPFVRVKATITHKGVAVATGLAEENRQQGQINRTSALENCETSAIGRALAAFGLHGGEYASGDEVTGAIAKQEKANGDFVKSNLKARSHEIVRELHACMDMDQLHAYWCSDPVKDAMKRMQSHYTEGFAACMAAKDEMKRNLTPAELLGAG